MEGDVEDPEERGYQSAVPDEPFIRMRMISIRHSHETNAGSWVVIVFLRGGFLTTPDSAGSMAQRDNRHIDNG
jgi:hypothetical protein